MNIKNFFPQVEEKYFKGIYDALIEVGSFSADKMDTILSSFKKDYPKNWEDLAYQNITTKGANNIKKLTQRATEETACGFSMIKQEELFSVFEGYIDMYGTKKGVQLFQEHIEKTREEFLVIKEKFPNTTEIKQKY